MNKEIFISTVNGIDIYAVKNDNSEIYVPIKPICTALGVDVESQRDKIKEDDILSSSAVLSTVVAADGKQREMLCLPLQYIYGWIFTINPSRVATDAKEKVLAYRRECYDALYRHFTNSLRTQLESNEAEIAALKAVNNAIIKEKEAKTARREAEALLADIRARRLNSYPELDL